MCPILVWHCYQILQQATRGKDEWLHRWVLLWMLTERSAVDWQPRLIPSNKRFHRCGWLLTLEVTLQFWCLSQHMLHDNPALTLYAQRQRRFFVCMHQPKCTTSKFRHVQAQCSECSSYCQPVRLGELSGQCYFTTTRTCRKHIPLDAFF